MEPTSDLLTVTDAGLYCADGDFYIDPWLPVSRAVITHAHADHARAGSQRYLTTSSGRAILQHRLGADAHIETVEYGQFLTFGRVQLSLHPAGHILGSAQVRLERLGEVWVVSGDYKRACDPTCKLFEPVRCHTFVTESTFGLPIYCWPDVSTVIGDIRHWWAANRDAGLVSILYAYALGKAQRLIASLTDPPGPVLCHGAVEALNACYRASGIDLPATSLVEQGQGKSVWQGALIVAPPSAAGSPWLRKFGDFSSAFASGWMLVRGQRRRRAVDRGFVISDHADWPSLLETISATGADRVLVTHGTSAAMAHWLQEHGLQADVLATRFEGELTEGADTEVRP